MPLYFHWNLCLLLQYVSNAVEEKAKWVFNKLKGAKQILPYISYVNLSVLLCVWRVML